jgi:hypothetical protein
VAARGSGQLRAPAGRHGEGGEFFFCCFFLSYCCCLDDLPLFWVCSGLVWCFFCYAVLCLLWGVKTDASTQVPLPQRFARTVPSPARTHGFSPHQTPHQTPHIFGGILQGRSYDFISFFIFFNLACFYVCTGPLHRWNALQVVGLHCCLPVSCVRRCPFHIFLFLLEIRRY